MDFWQINDKLCDPKNWTDELRYVHRTRLGVGIVIGLIIGLLL